MKYHGKRFNREQIEYVAWCILDGVLNQVELDLPTFIKYEERCRNPLPTDLSALEEGGLEVAGWSLSIFYAQLTGHGLGTNDALEAADNFDEAIRDLVYNSWKDEGEGVNKAIAKYEGKVFDIGDLLPNYPDIDKHARKFADFVMEKYEG